MALGVLSVDLLARLCFAVPLAYIGVTMVLDPAGFSASVHALARAVQTVANRFQGRHWLPPAETAPAPRARIAVRIVGLLLLACSALAAVWPR